MHKRNLIAGSAIIIFVVGMVAAGRYVAMASRSNLATTTAQSMSPTIKPLSSSSMATMPVTAAKSKIDSVDVMVERLRARLETEPNDVNGWVLLGRSYHYLERWDDAKAAFAKARELGYQDDSEPAANSRADAVGTDASESMPAAPNGDAIFKDIGRVGQGDGATSK